MSTEAASVTQLLNRWKGGDDSAQPELIESIYPVLRAQAQAQLGGLPITDLTLCATELAHEAYERLVKQQGVDWQNRNHFYAIAATVLRRVLVDYIRNRSASKRGGGIADLSLDELACCQLPDSNDFVDLLALDLALDQLGSSDPDLLKVVELRIFSGLSSEQIAEACGISVATVGRRWRFARSWLSLHLGEGND